MKRDGAIEWRRRFPERAREISRKSYAKLKSDIFAHYGSACACCGESGRQFLAIDHIEGNGAAHRREVGSIMFWLRKKGFPGGFQILCHNCNMARSTHGYCHEVPHR